MAPGSTRVSSSARPAASRASPAFSSTAVSTWALPSRPPGSWPGHGPTRAWARMSRRRLAGHEVAGVLVSMLGLVALAVSLTRASGEGAGGSTAEILLWLGATAAAAVVALAAGQRLGALAVAEGLAGGLFFSIGDISVKVATQGGARAAFAFGVVVGYALGTAFLQLGYQKGGALTVAGLATLLTNALPIAAGTVA